MLLRTESPAVGEAVGETDASDDREPASPGIEGQAQRVPPSGAIDDMPIAVEAIAVEGERLPSIDLGDAAPMVRMRREDAATRPFDGARFLDALVSTRVVWVRWDTARTRSRFVAAKFSGSTVDLPSGEVGFLLQDLVLALAHRGFSVRLDGSTLRIGAKGVYDGPREPPGPSPR